MEEQKMENQNTEMGVTNMENNSLENLNVEKVENNMEGEYKTETKDLFKDKLRVKIPFVKTFRTLILTIILIAFAAVVFALFIKKIKYKEKVDLKAIPTVNVTHVKIGQIEKEITVNGEIKPNDIYYVVSKVGGDLKKIYVKNGDHVKKGDPICDIDASKEIEAAFIEYDTAKKNFERMQKLYMAGDISQQNYEQVKAQYDGKKLAYDTKVEYSTVVAVDDGVIESTDMTLNTAISAGKVLCYITSNEAKEIEFGVTERVLNGITIGEKVTIEKSGVIYEGKITNISKLINSNDGLFHVKAVILSKNNFATGVNAAVTFVYDRRINTQILSNDVIYYETGQAYIFIVDENNVTRKKYIEVGLENKDITEVLTKIDKKEKIVSTWNKDLAEGSPIKIGIDEEVVDDIIKETEKETMSIIDKDVKEETTFDNKDLEKEKDIIENEESIKVDSVINELGEKLGFTKFDDKDKERETEINTSEVVKENIVVNEVIEESEVIKDEKESNIENTSIIETNTEINSIEGNNIVESENVEAAPSAGVLRDNMIIDDNNTSFSEVK